MMRSLYSAVSGLKTHQTRMDVIGNNISNVNTEAFKSSTVTFSELMYQTTSNATSGNGATGTGGVNAKQIGLGVKTGSTAVSIETAGAAETTGNPFDLKLTDSQTTNFFIVSDGTNTMFTRAGSFYVDGNGYLCMSSTGYTLMGWQVDPTTGDIRKDTVSSLQIMSPDNQTSQPEMTTKAYVAGILDKNDTNLEGDGYVTNLSIYDNLGYPYTCKFRVVPTKEPSAADPTVMVPVEGSYQYTLADIQDKDGKSIFEGMDAAAAQGIRDTMFAPATINYDRSNGKFIPFEVTPDGDPITFRTIDFSTFADPAGANFANFPLPQFSTTDPATGTPVYSIDVDFASSLNYNNGGTSTFKANAGDAIGDGKGKKVGALTGLTVNSDGKVYGTYDNGNTTLLCQIAAAQFSNASGLEKVGENCYMTTLNSGEFDGVGVEIDADGSSMSTGELEMSNVDLSSEFTSMIITQRGFQANSRVITTSDTLLEELINLKR